MIKRTAAIKCPKCGIEAKETMPEDQCVIIYKCQRCKVTLRPQKGDCCVFCSYSDVKCPPMQVKVCCTINGSRF